LCLGNRRRGDGSVDPYDLSAWLWGDMAEYGYGRPIAIGFGICGRVLISIWLVGPNGILTLVTPFGSCSRRAGRSDSGGRAG